MMKSWTLLFLAPILIFFYTVESTGIHTKGNQSLAYLLKRISSSTPSHTSKDVDWYVFFFVLRDVQHTKKKQHMACIGHGLRGQASTWNESNEAKIDSRCARTRELVWKDFSTRRRERRFVDERIERVQYSHFLCRFRIGV